MQPTCLDTYFSSFEESLAPTHMQRRALSNYRFQLRRFGRVLEADGVGSTSLTLEIADRLARQVPFDRVNAVRIPNLVRRFVLHLISIGVAIPPPVCAAQTAKDKLLDDLERFLLGQRGLSPSSVYHVKRYAVRFLDHRFGDTVPDPSAIRHQDIVAFLEHIRKGKGDRSETRKFKLTRSGRFCQHRTGRGRKRQEHTDHCTLSLDHSAQVADHRDLHVLVRLDAHDCPALVLGAAVKVPVYPLSAPFLERFPGCAAMSDKAHFSNS
jgi:hypothetical protein